MCGKSCVPFSQMCGFFVFAFGCDEKIRRYVKLTLMMGSAVTIKLTIVFQ